MFSIVNRLSGGGKAGLAQFVNSGSGVMEWYPYESKMNSKSQKEMMVKMISKKTAGVAIKFPLVLIGWSSEQTGIEAEEDAESDSFTLPSFIPLHY